MERTSVKCGKVCPTGKKCSRKTGGGFCYQHDGSSSARTATPKKASPKKSPKKSPDNSIPWLDALPMPALQQAMLNMDYHTLNATCRTNKRAASICRSANFREMYMKKDRGTLFFGELKEHNIIRNPSNRENMATLFDDAGNELNIVYDKSLLEFGKITLKRIIYGKKNSKIKIILEIGPNSSKKMFVGHYHFGRDVSKPQEVEKFLDSIGKTRWFSEKVTSEGRQASEKSANEFYDFVKKATINLKL